MHLLLSYVFPALYTWCWLYCLFDEGHIHKYKRKSWCLWMIHMYICLHASLCFSLSVFSGLFFTLCLWQNLLQHIQESDWSFLAKLAAWLYGWPCQSVGRSVHHFGPDWNISITLGWIALQLCSDIHCPQRMKPTSFGEPLTFPLAPPVGWRFWLYWNVFQTFMFPSGWTVIALVTPFTFHPDQPPGQSFNEYFALWQNTHQSQLYFVIRAN